MAEEGAWEGEVDAAEARRKAEEYGEERDAGDAALAGHKISLPVGVLIVVCAFIMDVAAEVPLAGDVEEAPAAVGLIVSNIFGLGQTIQVVIGAAMFLRALPLVQELPGIWTAAAVITWWMDANPSKATAKAQQLAATAAKAEGGSEASMGEVAEGAGVAAAKTTEEAGEAAKGTVAGTAAAGGGVGAGEAAQDATEAGATAGGGTAAGGEAGVAEGGVEAAPAEGAPPEKEISPEALGEERPPMEQAQKELVGEEPVTGEETGAPAEEGAGEKEAPEETEAERKAREAQERAKKIVEKAKRILAPEEEEGKGD